MNIEKLHELFEAHHDHDELAWEGACEDCGKPTTVVARLTPKGIEIFGGALWEGVDRVYLKCEPCHEENPKFKESTLVYSRIVGYMRPTKDWADHKQDEFKDRKVFNLDDIPEDDIDRLDR